MRKVVFLFGRFQVPTKGHEEMIRYGFNYAKRIGADFRVYTSKSQDPVKNPLPYQEKIKFLHQLFPGINIVDDPNVRTAFDICRQLSDAGVDEVTMVVGGDRVAEFQRAIGKYVIPRNTPGFDPRKNYAFKKFEVVNSGGRKAGVSGTQMRQYIKAGKFTEFAKVAPTADKKLARAIFAAAKRNLREDIIEEEKQRYIRWSDHHNKTFRVTEPEGHSDREGFSIVTPENGKAWTDWKDRPSMDKVARKVMNKPGNLSYKYHQIKRSAEKQGIPMGSPMKHNEPKDESDMLKEEGVSRKDFHKELEKFVEFTCKKLGIKEAPHLTYKEDGKDGHQPSFGGYSPGEKKLIVYTKNRHPMDIFRTVAHELVHHKQNEDGRLGHNVAEEGATGSKIENEANADAGKVMRYFGAENPSYFDMNYVREEKAIILAGTPGSGKDKILKEAILPHDFKEVGYEAFGKFVPAGRIVITGTSNYDKICEIKEQLDLRGYDAIMVFVNTSNEVSKQRNEARQGKGRVISENVRFSKWMLAQEDLNKYDHIFEKVIEVKNDLNLNQSESVIQETYGKLIDSVNKEIESFILSEADRDFENMLSEQYRDFSNTKRSTLVGGAGNWGTSKLTHRYQKDTPGQPTGFRDMKVLKMSKKNKDKNVKVYGKMPQFNDRLGQTYTSAKNPSFSGDTTADTNNYMNPEPISVMRWSMSEETKRRFKERYGQLAEQKIKETAERLTRKESLEDPYTGLMGATPNMSNRDEVDFGGANKKAADQEATSLFGKRKRLNRNKEFFLLETTNKEK